MADKKISDLTAIASQSSTDLSEVSLNGSGSRKETRAQQQSYMQSNLDFIHTTGSITGGDVVIYTSDGKNAKSSGVNIDSSRNITNAGSLSLSGALNMDSNLINNVTDPSSAQDAMTLNYFNNKGIFPHGTSTLTNPASVQTIAAGTMYQANGSGGPITFQLPSGITDGYFGITGINANGWTLDVGSGQTIMIANTTATTDGSDSWNSNTGFETVIFKCTASNTAEAVSFTGLPYCNNGTPLPTNLVTTNSVSGATFTATGNNAYWINAGGSQSHGTLASSFNFFTEGTEIHVFGNSSGGWKLTYGTGWSIMWEGNSSTTSTGYIQSTTQYDWIKLKYIGSNIWQVIEFDGNPQLDTGVYLGANKINAVLAAGSGLTKTNSGGVVTFATSAASLNVNSNIVIGGNFDTNPWQTGVTFAAAANDSITADNFKWFQSGTTTGVVTVAKAADAPSFAQAGLVCTNSLGLTVTTAQSSIGANDYYHYTYTVEGSDWTQLFQQAFTISFQVKSSLTGTYCFSIFNNGGTRTYIAEYTISVANTWQQIIINVPSDSTGTWNLTPSTIGAYLNWTFAGGSSVQGSTGWHTTVTGNYCTSNQVNLLATNSNTFKIDLVYLQPGTWSTIVYPFELYTDVLSRSQRYVNTSVNFQGGSYFPTSSSIGIMGMNLPTAGTAAMAMQVMFPVTMATNPTITLCDPAAATGKVYKGGNGQAAWINTQGPCGFEGGSNSANSANGLQYHYYANGMLF